MAAREFCVALMVACAWAAAPGYAQSPGAKVKLTLNKVAGDRQDSDVLFTCEATLDNETGKVLYVHSSFFSTFDGVTLVVFDASGKKLKQQGYTFHQSPSAPPGNVHSLAKGKNTKTLVFPISELPADVKKFRVCLVGHLPGSEPDPGLLTSDLIDVNMK
jgi:hypothetical protein